MIYEEELRVMDTYTVSLARTAERERLVSRLDRENRELRGDNRKLGNEVIALRHGIQKVVDECQTMLQDG